MKTKLKSATNTGKRILLVDDDPKVLEVFSALLQEAGYQVDKAEHALAAVAAVVRAVPDLVLADIQMPIVGGMDLVRELKAHCDSCLIPVVAFTGHDSPDIRQAAGKAGYDDYLVKPTEVGQFPAQIAKLLRKFNPKKSPRRQKPERPS